MRVEKENSYMNKEVRKKLSDLKVKKIFWPRYMLANVLIFLDIRFKAGLACTHCSFISQNTAYFQFSFIIVKKLMKLNLLI